MRSSKRSRTRKPLHKRYLVASVVILALAVAVLVFAVRKAITTTPAPIHHITHGTVVGSSPVTGNSSSASSAGQGGAIDEKGKLPSSRTPESQWITSNSGNITLQQPSKEARLQSGDSIGGTAKVGTVQYRLVDNSVGVIAQGPLSVVNGRFSGILQFNSTSDSGSLDVFSFSPTSGAEINEIQIPVKFSQ